MVGLLLPKKFAAHKDKLFVAQIFIVDEKGHALPVGIFPAPTNETVNGAFLSQIKANFDAPLNSMLQTALQNNEVKVMFRITELEKFRAEKAKADALRLLRSSKQPTTPRSERSSNDN